MLVFVRCTGGIEAWHVCNNEVVEGGRLRDTRMVAIMENLQWDALKP